MRGEAVIVTQLAVTRGTIITSLIHGGRKKTYSSSRATAPSGFWKIVPVQERTDRVRGFRKQDIC